MDKVDKVTYAIVAVGGFLGMGERLVAVPFGALKPQQNSYDLILAGANKDACGNCPSQVPGPLTRSPVVRREHPLMPCRLCLAGGRSSDPLSPP